MSMEPHRSNQRRSDTTARNRAPERAPGEGGVVLLGLAIGILMMGIQLWLLTLAFDLYLSGERGDTVLVAVCSGLLFIGGLVMLRILDRSTRTLR